MYPTYVITDDISASDAAWLQDQDGYGPLDLVDITDVCVTMSVAAVVRTAGGDALGYVDPKGVFTRADDACDDAPNAMPRAWVR